MNNTNGQTDFPNLISVLNRMKAWGHARLINNEIYINYSKHLKTLKSEGEIAAFFSYILDQDIFPSIVMINQTIKKLGQQGLVNVALEFHKIATARGIATPITYASTIDAIAKCPAPDSGLAITLFHEAKNLNYIDAYIYTSTITAIVNSSNLDLELAVALYLEAWILGFANEFTYDITMSTITKNASRTQNFPVTASQPSNLMQNSIFSNPKKTSMNPNAQEFVPTKSVG